MINKKTQQQLNRVVSGLPVLFVFKSKVHYDMYFPTVDGVLKYDGDTCNWIHSEFNTKDELVETFYEIYPVYSNINIFHNIDWNSDDNVSSLTNRSLTEWI